MRINYLQSIFRKGYITNRMLKMFIYKFPSANKQAD